MLYFSYGSNMSHRRLGARVPSARFVAVATLQAHSLRFHKRGHDLSAKCDALHTGDPEHSVIGVVFHISPDEKPFLDRVEGLGNGYEEKTVSLVSREQKIMQAFTYYATAIDQRLRPFCWYREHVLRGCTENALPAAYTELIENTPFMPDPDRERAGRELAIYR